LASTSGFSVVLEGEQHHHRVLQHVVVERAEELGEEQRQEAAGAQQAGL
jgi:hypothetical protein